MWGSELWDELLPLTVRISGFETVIGLPEITSGERQQVAKLRCQLIQRG
jgi:hypothetical protein